jgi:hypothetical protein
MELSTQVAKHFKDVHFGGNWTTSNIKDNLSGISWEQATTCVGTLNTIAALTFHINYYVSAVLKVLEGGSLEASDKFSFDHPPINSQEDWEKMVAKTLHDAEKFGALVEKLPATIYSETFIDEKYGTWFRNMIGIIEHTHYHLGQIAIIKKLILGQSKS